MLAHSTTNHYRTNSVNVPGSPSCKRTVLLVGIIFITAFTFKAASWYYWRAEASTVQSTIALSYKVFARLLTNEGLQGFFSAQSQMSDPYILGHPPGYPLVLAGVYKTFGESDTPVQFLQIIVDALAAVVLFLIIAELLHSTAAFIAGILSAVSPQFAWNSIMLLPDTLAVFPLLLSIYFLVRARRKSSTSLLFLVGVLIGTSCLLRPNALFLAPLIAVLMWATNRGQTKTRQLIAATVLLTGTMAVIAPVTIRNTIVFHRFIPLSLGSGQTLLEGIADYDTERRFGFPNTDVEIARMEAEVFNRPDYAQTLFGRDGLERERVRLRRGTEVIISNPGWFASVMIRRAASMLRLERVPLISVEMSKAHGYPPVFRAVQSVFITAIILPLAIIGAALLAFDRRWFVLETLLVIPVYYFLVQSALHTEYRYVLALDHFLFAFAALSLFACKGLFSARLGRLNKSQRE